MVSLGTRFIDLKKLLFLNYFAIFEKAENIKIGCHGYIFQLFVSESCMFKSLHEIFLIDNFIFHALTRNVSVS